MNKEETEIERASERTNQSGLVEGMKTNAHNPDNSVLVHSVSFGRWLALFRGEFLSLGHSFINSSFIYPRIMAANILVK